MNSSNWLGDDAYEDSFDVAQACSTFIRAAFRRMPTANAEGLDLVGTVGIGERSRRDASLAAVRSTRVLGARRRHAPRCCKNEHVRGHLGDVAQEGTKLRVTRRSEQGVRMSHGWGMDLRFDGTVQRNILEEHPMERPVECLMDLRFDRTF